MYISRTTILGIALAIEQHGIDFYTRVKARLADPLLDFLIGAEKMHIRTLNGIFGKDTGSIQQERFEVPHLDDDYLIAAFAGTEVFAKADPETVSKADLYATAVEMEKDSILFYRELVDALAERFPAEADLVRAVEREEREHLRLLAAKKRELTGK